ncbi:MAG: hypothetical protein Q9170_007115 [Blastenia crenularia]
MLQLHVWGPAFGLPSIDPQCLATIAYLSQAIPQGEWELVASSNPTLTPTRDLPAVRHGSVWIGGFRNIIHYLQHNCEGQWQSLDRNCNPQDQADISAYTSFLETRAQPLIDLSLYVSSENYHTTTRPAYSNILQWPQTWLLPPKRRAAAKARTEYLGFSALDLDAATENNTAKPNFAAGTEIPRILQSNMQRNVSSLMKQPQHAARFRLDTLAEAFLEPMETLLGGKRYLLEGDGMTSLDCLALGYFALALVPEVPQSWLQQAMKSHYPDLCRYVKDLGRECFGITLSTEEGKNQSNDTATTLPWQISSSGTTSPSLSIRSTLESLPYIGALYQPPPLQLSTTQAHKDSIRIPIIPTIFLGFTTTAMALAGYVLFTGNMPFAAGFPGWYFGGRPRGRRLQDMGDAGALLGSVRFGERSR